TRRKDWEKETLPGASSLQRCRRKQRCISIIIWESRSASARNCAVVGSASVASNFTALKLGGEINVSTAGRVILSIYKTSTSLPRMCLAWGLHCHTALV